VPDSPRDPAPADQTTGQSRWEWSWSPAGRPPQPASNAAR
jgi:hypothetical protein